MKLATLVRLGTMLSLTVMSLSLGPAAASSARICRELGEECNPRRNQCCAPLTCVAVAPGEPIGFCFPR